MSRGVSRRRFLAGATAACALGTGAVAASRGDGVGREEVHEGEEAAPAQSRDGRPESLESFVDDRMAAVLAEDGADGATVAVVRDGEVALTKGYGHAFRSPDNPVEGDATPFRVGSVSKVVAYAAAMQQVDRGTVDSTAPAREYLESVSIPDGEGTVTLAHLATHTAGFEERSAGNIAPGTSPEAVPPLPEALAANDPARVRPAGGLPGYTNYNAGLAAQLVADVAGTTFAEYARREVFAPLGMSDSSFEPAPEGLVPDPEVDVADAVDWYSAMPPASGMTATAADMGRLAVALVGDGSAGGGRLFSPAAAETFRDQWDTPHDGLAGFAFGMERHDRGGTLVLRHGGGVPYFASDLLLVPERDLALFVSVHGDRPFEPEEAFVDAFLERFVPVDAPSVSPDGRPTRADNLGGRYRPVNVDDAASYDKPLLSLTSRPAEVEVRDDGTLVTTRGGETREWVEEAPLLFRRADGAERLAFAEGSEGELHLIFGDAPASPLAPVGPLGGGALHGPLAAAAIAVLLSGLLGWPARGACRRVRTGSWPSVGRRPLVAGAATAGWPLAFVVGAVLFVASRGLYDPPPWTPLLFAVPVVGVLATLWGLYEAGEAWREPRWGRAARVHYATVAAASVVLLWLFSAWNLLGGRL